MSNKDLPLNIYCNDRCSACDHEWLDLMEDSLKCPKCGNTEDIVCGDFDIFSEGVLLAYEEQEL